MLLTHSVPDHVVVGETLPAFADLGRMTEGGGVQIGKDPEGDFGGCDGEKVDAEEGLQMVGEEGELGHTALSEKSAENELTMASWSAAKQRPNVGDDLLVLLWEACDVLGNTTA